VVFITEDQAEEGGLLQLTGWVDSSTFPTHYGELEGGEWVQREKERIKSALRAHRSEWSGLPKCRVEVVKRKKDGKLALFTSWRPLSWASESRLGGTT
jgi:hypothetical protein